MTPSEETDRISEAIDAITFDAGAQERAPTRERPTRFERILVATDGSPDAQQAVAWTAAVAPVFNARVWPATVVRSVDRLASYDARGWIDAKAVQGELEQASRRHLDEAVGSLRGAAAEPIEPLVGEGSPGDAIVTLSQAHDIDLVVLGARGHSRMGRLLLGSVSDRVKDHVDASVFLAKGRPPAKRILVGVDGSAHSKRAASVAMQLARAWGARVGVVHVFPYPVTQVVPGRTAVEEAFKQAEPSWGSDRVRPLLAFGHPADGILTTAQREGSDLIVLGTRGLSGLQRLATGSVSNRVAHQANVSVLLVR